MFTKLFRFCHHPALRGVWLGLACAVAVWARALRDSSPPRVGPVRDNDIAVSEQASGPVAHAHPGRVIGAYQQARLAGRSGDGPGLIEAPPGQGTNTCRAEERCVTPRRMGPFAKTSVRDLLDSRRSTLCVRVTRRAAAAARLTRRLHGASRTTRKPTLMLRSLGLFWGMRTAARCSASRHMKQPPRITRLGPSTGASGSTAAFVS